MNLPELNLHFGRETNRLYPGRRKSFPGRWLALDEEGFLLAASWIYWLALGKGALGEGSSSGHWLALGEGTIPGRYWLALGEGSSTGHVLDSWPAFSTCLRLFTFFSSII